MKKKSQGLPLNIIIVAIILLIVMTVILYLFISKGINPFKKGLGACTEKGGVCREAPCPSTHPIPGFIGCYDESKNYQENWTCCFKE